MIGPDTYIINTYLEIKIVQVKLEIWNTYSDRINTYYTIKNGTDESYYGSLSVKDIIPKNILSINKSGDLVMQDNKFVKQLYRIILDY